ncbi:MAG: hypothetical protein HQK49_06700 [Oligoflexia bacterium]|nr:hypothetical protein [Oligoflexia bacterium]
MNRVNKIIIIILLFTLFNAFYFIYGHSIKSIRVNIYDGIASDSSKANSLNNINLSKSDLFKTLDQLVANDKISAKEAKKIKDEISKMSNSDISKVTERAEGMFFRGGVISREKIYSSKFFNKDFKDGNSKAGRSISSINASYSIDRPEQHGLKSMQNPEEVEKQLQQTQKDMEKILAE